MCDKKGICVCRDLRRVGGKGGVWQNQKCAEEKSLVVVVKGAEIKVSVHV